MDSTTPSDHFVTSCQSFRQDIANFCTDVIAFKEDITATPPQAGQNRGEEMANIMLAYRHLEDAAMRFGKAIQAHTTGVSPLGGPTTPGVAAGAQTITSSTPTQPSPAEEAKI